MHFAAGVWRHWVSRTKEFHSCHAGLAEVRANGNFTCRMFSRFARTPIGWLANRKLRLNMSPKPSSLPKPRTAKWLQAETLRLRGDLLHIIGDSAGAEASFLDAITLAQRQGARLFQLRASTSLARLWRDQGRHKEAGEVVVPIANEGPAFQPPTSSAQPMYPLVGAKLPSQ